MSIDIASLRQQLPWSISGRPALAAHRRTLALVWRDGDDGRLWMAHGMNDQLSNAEATEIPFEYRDAPTDPAMATQDDGAVVVAWAEPQSETIQVLSLARSTEFRFHALVNVEPAHPPALCYGGWKLLVGWTDRHGRVWLASMSRNRWAEPILIDEAIATGPPALAANANQVWVAWTGRDGSLMVASNRVGRSFESRVRHDAHPTGPPALAMHRSAPAAAWIEDDVLRVVESANDFALTSEPEVPCVASSGPALASNGRDLFVAWTSAEEPGAITMTQPTRTRPDLQSEFVFHGNTVRYDPSLP